MSYGFSSDHTATSNDFPVAPNIPNCFLETAEYELIKDQYPALKIVWGTDGGRRLTQNIFGVDESNSTPFPGMSLEDTLKIKYNRINTVLFKIAQAFGISREELQKEMGITDNFKEFAVKYAKFINEQSAGKLVKLKTMTGSRGYVELAERGTFIAPNDSDIDLEYSKWERDKNAENEGKKPKKAVQKAASSGGLMVADEEIEDESSWFADED